MTDKIKQCTCGNKKFTVIETYKYIMKVDDEGEPTTRENLGGGVVGIICTECLRKYNGKDFEQIIF